MDELLITCLTHHSFPQEVFYLGHQSLLESIMPYELSDLTSPTPDENFDISKIHVGINIKNLTPT
jgi:hypothetical protein